MKVCAKCEKHKTENEFSKQKQATDGLQRWCKKCSSDEKKKWSKKNRHMINDYQKRYFINNPDKKNKYNSRYYKNNSDKKKNIAKKWYNDNREKALNRISKYQKLNKALVDGWKKKYRDNNKDKSSEYHRLKWAENIEINRAKANMKAEKLTDGYIKNLGSIRHIKNIPKEIIDAKRNLIIIKRLTNEKKTTG